MEAGSAPRGGRDTCIWQPLLTRVCTVYVVIVVANKVGRVPAEKALQPRTQMLRSGNLLCAFRGVQLCLQQLQDACRTDHLIDLGAHRASGGLDCCS